MTFAFVPNAAYQVSAVQFPCGPGIEQSDGSWQATFDVTIQVSAS
jgi:hypothetical protein